MKGAVASGHPLTSEAACAMLRKGGNAFDAVVAAGFASTVTEPTLTSLGGGGFLLTHAQETDENVLVDFFVNTPGLGCTNIGAPALTPVDVRFRSTVQRFHIGLGSVAVPGTLKGLIHCYEKFCSFEIEDILKPTLACLENGVEISGSMSYLLEMLKPILTLTEYGKEIFNLDKIKKLYNPLLKEFLSDVSPGKWIDKMYGISEWPVREEERTADCLLTKEDFKRYDVVERRPLSIPYRGYEILSNPPPSFGGILIKLTLALLQDYDISSMDDSARAHLFASLMKTINDMRKDTLASTAERFPFKRDIVLSGKAELENILRGGSSISTQGTTHISVIDSDGNAASMTASNGSNSGYFFGETGIMLNNMMGEDDLHPYGFYSLPPGRRVSSMMSPSFILSNGSIFAVMGSGGSKRIRTAIPQTIVNLIDKKMVVVDAVESSRLHLDDEDILQIEPGVDDRVTEHLKKHFNVNRWQHKDMYFGGVHTVLYDLSGQGDSRRSGSFLKA